MASSSSSSPSSSRIEALIEEQDCTHYWLAVRDADEQGVAFLDLDEDATAFGIKSFLQQTFGVPRSELRIELPSGEVIADDQLLQELQLPCPPLLYVEASTQELTKALDFNLFHDDLSGEDDISPSGSFRRQSPSDNEEDPALRASSRSSGSTSSSGELAPASSLLCSFFDVRRVNPTSRTAGLVTVLSTLLFERQIDELAAILEKVPPSCLLSALPLIIAMHEEPVTAFLARRLQENASIAQRIQLLSNERPAFSHMLPLTVHVPPSEFVGLCQRTTFERDQTFAMTSVHPISGAPITAVHVDHVFKSLARPSILSFVGTSESSGLQCGALSRVLVKKNEDIYEEASIQVLFRLMNELWESELPEELRPFVCSFREVPASPSLGFLQIIEGCNDLEVVERGNFELITNHENFIRTTCGWCLAAYVLGLSDRHRENTLVRLEDSSAIPIDFGFMLGKTAPSVNTYMVTVSEEMHRYLLARDAWSAFGAMFLAGFWALRRHVSLFTFTASRLFEGQRDTAFIRKFIRHRLLSHERTPELAVKRMLKRLRHAPVCSETKSKINNHAKNKRFLAQHGGNVVVRFIIRRAVEADPELKSGRHIHLDKARYTFPSAFPEDTPAELLTIFEWLGQQKRSSLFDWSVFRSSDCRREIFSASRNLSLEAYEPEPTDTPRSRSPSPPATERSAQAIPRLFKTISNLVLWKRRDEVEPPTIALSAGALPNEERDLLVAPQPTQATLLSKSAPGVVYRTPSR